MMKHRLFLRWWLLFVLSTVGLGISYKVGWLHDIYVKDPSMISFAIIALFFVATVWCGVVTGITDFTTAKLGLEWNLKPKGRMRSDKYAMVKYGEDALWFISEVLLTLGMIGTVVGFVMMLQEGFSSYNPAQPDSVKTMLDTMSTGMSTALYTTLVGLICSTLLKFQCFNLTQMFDLYRGQYDEV